MTFGKKRNSERESLFIDFEDAYSNNENSVSSKAKEPAQGSLRMNYASLPLTPAKKSDVKLFSKKNVGLGNQNLKVRKNSHVLERKGNDGITNGLKGEKVFGTSVGKNLYISIKSRKHKEK